MIHYELIILLIFILAASAIIIPAITKSRRFYEGKRKRVENYLESPIKLQTPPHKLFPKEAWCCPKCNQFTLNPYNKKCSNCGFILTYSPDTWFSSAASSKDIPDLLDTVKWLQNKCDELRKEKNNLIKQCEQIASERNDALKKLKHERNHNKSRLKRFNIEYYFVNDQRCEKYRCILESDTPKNARLLLFDTERLDPGSIVITYLVERENNV